MAKFKTRARALDLLGRQQIAGIPTAINELIKNAYDAYADNFDASYLRTKNMIILRDDGIGMSREDFENRWLVLGTESKMHSESSLMPPIDPNKPRRAISGEKGIGRLAIASIGSQVLVLTKAKFSNEAKIVAAFLDWDLFEVLGLNLEDVVIPMTEYDNMPNADDVRVLIEQAILNWANLYEKKILSLDEYNKHKDRLNSLHINPSALVDRLQGNFDLRKVGGTHFYITSVSESLSLDLKKDDDSDEATKMETTLLGFHNTMTPDHQTPSINIVFRDYRDDGDNYVNIIDEEQFFTPEDYSVVDHHIKGVFDSYGNFHGTITIFGENVFDYNLTWKNNHSRATSCGPFSIDLAVLQGNGKESRLATTNYDRIWNKANRIGGLYIYRNNIRVLPYGSHDYDFVDIEKRRTLKASTWYFSYRRMFGAIEVQDAKHSSLIEKAGREGFIENLAYKQFRAILKNFFAQLALEIFGERADGIVAEIYKNKKEELKKASDALAKREKLAKEKKSAFEKALRLFFDGLDRNVYKNTIERIIQDFEINLGQIRYTDNSDEWSQCFIEQEVRVRKQIKDYQESVYISVPKGFVTSKNMRDDYEEFVRQYGLLCNTIFQDAYNRVDQIIAEYTSRFSVEISKRRRLFEAVESITKEAEYSSKKKRKETTTATETVKSKIDVITRQLMLDLEIQIQEIKAQFQTLEMQGSDDFDLMFERRKMEDKIDAVSRRNEKVMDKIIRQLEGIYVQKDDEGNYITNQDMEDAMSEELDDLRTRLNSDNELSQLGLAIAILNHEFSSTVNSIKRSIKDLKAWSEVNTELTSLYQNVKINFEHLDSYLNLMTPLDRRMEREKVDIPLADIRIFLDDLFRARLNRHHIQLKHTKGFEKRALNGYRSTFYPVFVNIVDNAIYWLQQSESEEKIIRLHADDTGIYISNNGPKINMEDKERIFDLRFSRKINGRGLGLSISRDVLNDVDYEIFVDTPRENSTVTFKIQKKG